MATSQGKVSYSSLSKLEKGNTNLYYDDDFSDSVWAMPQGSRSSKQDYSYQYPLQSEDFVDEECDSIEEPCNSTHQYGMPPEVNLKNVLGGIFAILTGRNKGIGDAGSQQSPTSNVSFLGSGKNGDSFLHPSVYIPSAPPLLEPSGINYSAYKEVLDAEPPEWVPDSSTTVCMQCTAPFTALTRGRHHCRFCGGIFCRACTKGRSLLPVKFRERNPQRVCDACYDRLDPLQNILINSISNAAQVAKHDVMDWTCTRGWLNLPVGLSMEHEIYKPTSTVRSYYQVARLNPKRSILLALLKRAKGLAIITVAKASMLVPYKLGIGLVIARRSNGLWPAPSFPYPFSINLLTPVSTYAHHSHPHSPCLHEPILHTHSFPFQYSLNLSFHLPFIPPISYPFLIVHLIPSPSSLYTTCTNPFSLTSRAHYTYILSTLVTYFLLLASILHTIHLAASINPPLSLGLHPPIPIESIIHPTPLTSHSVVTYPLTCMQLMHALLTAYHGPHHTHTSIATSLNPIQPYS